MTENFSDIRDRASAAIAAATDVKAIDELRVSFLGKKGEITQIMKTMGTLAPADRPMFGQIANETRVFIENALETAKLRLSANELHNRLSSETVDVSLPGKQIYAGHTHPMTQVIREITDLFVGMGYKIAEGPEIEEDYYNFEALNIPANHPAKDEQDTFYLGGKFLLRTQTSSVQIRTMERLKPPIKILAPGKVFRSDAPDATHTPVFHQCEGLVVDKGVNMGDLKGALNTVAQKIFGADVRTRYRPSHFPFTEPSAELDVTCFACGGIGCPVCKGSGWVEMLGCGMVHPNVLRMAGIDPDVYSGFAFGIGLERIALSRYKITDIRLLFENDIRFLNQF